MHRIQILHLSEDEDGCRINTLVTGLKPLSIPTENAVHGEFMHGVDNADSSRDNPVLGRLVERVVAM